MPASGIDDVINKNIIFVFIYLNFIFKVVSPFGSFMLVQESKLMDGKETNE